MPRPMVCAREKARETERERERSARERGRERERERDQQEREREYPTRFKQYTITANFCLFNRYNR